MENRILFINEKRKEIETKKILHLTNKEFLTPTLYALFIPCEINKYPTKKEKFMLDKIAALETSVLVLVTTSILDDTLNLLLSQNDTSLVELEATLYTLRDKFKEISLEEMSCLKEVYTLIADKNKLTVLWKNAIDHLLSSIQYAKKNYLLDKFIFLLQELLSWLEGVHLHVSINVRRQEIYACIADVSQDMLKLVPHPVKEKKIPITYATQKAFMLIAEMNPKESLPIILTVLENIKQKTKHDFHAEEFLNGIDYSLKVLHDANEMQYKSVTELLSFLGNSNKIKEDLDGLVQSCKKMKVTQDNLQLCHELTLYLEGLYLHTYKDKDSFDIENKALSYATGGHLTKIIIASYYHLAAVEIESLMNEFEQNIKTDLIVKVPESGLDRECLNNANYTKQEKLQEERTLLVEALSPVPILEKVNIIDDSENKMPAEVLIDNKDIQLFKKLDGFHLIIPLEYESLLTDIEQFLKTKMQENKGEMLETQFWQILNEASHGSDENKINSLFNAIKKYELTTRQQDRLLYLKDKTISSLNRYKANTTLKWFLGSMSSYFFPRTHKEMAEATIKEVEREADPKHILSILFALHLVLPDKLSKELITITKQLLLDAYTMLWNMYHLVPHSQLQALYMPTPYHPMFFSPTTHLSQKVLPAPAASCQFDK